MNEPPAENRKLEAAELIISVLLRAGVVLSLVLILCGTIVSFRNHPNYTSSPQELNRLIAPTERFPRTIGEITKGLREGRGQTVVLLGLFVLIATPLLRVVVSIIMFAGQRDFAFTLMATAVLTFLLASFLIGHYY